MRSLKTMLIAGAAAGMMLGGAATASAQGIPEPQVRDCARQLASAMRSCGPRVSVEPQQGVSKRSESEQVRMPCGVEALNQYFSCAGGQQPGLKNNEVTIPFKSNVKASPTPKND